MHNSTGYVIKQLVHAFSCALSSYGALGKFGEHFFRALQTFRVLHNSIVNNYSPKWRWLAVDIYRAAKRRGKYQPLATSTEVNSCFSIY